MDLIMNIYFAAVSAYLSVVLARILKQNGRVLDKLDEGFKMMGTKIDEGFRRMDEGFKIMGTKMDEGFRKMDEGFKLIAQLIVEKNDQTKREILDALAKK